MYTMALHQTIQSARDQYHGMLRAAVRLRRKRIHIRRPNKTHVDHFWNARFSITVTPKYEATCAKDEITTSAKTTAKKKRLKSDLDGEVRSLSVEESMLITV